MSFSAVSAGSERETKSQRFITKVFFMSVLGVIGKRKRGKKSMQSIALIVVKRIP